MKGGTIGLLTFVGWLALVAVLLLVL